MGLAAKKVCAALCDAIVDTDIAQRKSLPGGCVNADDEEVMAQEIPEGRKKVTNFTRRGQYPAEDLRDDLDAESLAGGIVLQVSEKAPVAVIGFREEAQEKNVLFRGAEVKEAHQCLDAKTRGRLRFAVFVDP